MSTKNHCEKRVFEDFLSAKTGLAGQNAVLKKLAYLVFNSTQRVWLVPEENELLTHVKLDIAHAYRRPVDEENPIFETIKRAGLITEYPEYSLLLEASSDDVMRRADALLLVLIYAKRYRDITADISLATNQTPPSVISEATRSLRLYAATAKESELPHTIDGMESFLSAIKNGKFNAIERLIRYVRTAKSSDSRDVSGTKTGVTVDAEIYRDGVDDPLFTKNKTTVVPLLSEGLANPKMYLKDGYHPQELVANRLLSFDYEKVQPDALYRSRQQVATSAISQRNVASALAYERLSSIDIAKILATVKASSKTRFQSSELKAWEFECALALFLLTGRDLKHLVKLRIVASKNDVTLPRGALAYHKGSGQLALRLYEPQLSSSQKYEARIFLANAKDGKNVVDKPIIWLKTPKFLVELLNRRLANINTHEQPVKIFTARATVYEHAIKDLLSQLNRKHGTSLTITRVSQLFSYELLIVSNDSGVAYLLSGRDLRCGKVSAHYLFAPNAELSDYVSKAWQRIESQQSLQQLSFVNALQFKEADVGSKSNLTFGQLTLLVQHLKQKLGYAIRTSNSIDTHNFYVLYIYFWLAFVTGHRPVNAPLSSRKQIDFDSGFVSVSDKDDLAKSHSRVAWLTPKLLHQLKDYTQYISRVLSEIDRVDTLTASTGFLFLLDKRGLAQTITPARVHSLVPEWYLKTNVQRHFIRSELLGHGLVNYLMNHWVPGTEPHNKYAAISPNSAYESLTTEVLRIESSAGWSVKAVSDTNIAVKIRFPEARKLIGEGAREQRLRNQRKVAHLAFQKALEEKLPEVAQGERNVHISEPQVIKIIENFRSSYDPNTAELRSVISYFTKQLKAGHRKLGWSGYIPPATFVQKPAENPFRSEKFQQIGSIREDIDRFQFGIVKGTTMAEHRYQKERLFGEILFSCAMLGGLLDVKALRALPLYLLRIKRDNNIVWLTFYDDLSQFDSEKHVPNRRRWLIDPVTLSLLSRFNSSFTLDIATYSASSSFVERAFKQYARAVSLSFNTVDRLCAKAEIFLSLFIDQVAVQYSANKFHSTALQDESWLSAQCDQCYEIKGKFTELHDSKKLLPDFQFQDKKAPDLAESLKQFKSFRYSVRNNNQRMTKTQLVEIIDSAIELASKTSTTSGWLLLLKWFQSLVKKSIVQSTLMRYLSAIGLDVLATLQDNVSLDDQSAIIDAFQTLNTSFSEVENDRAYKLQRLAQFAHFTRQFYDQTPYIGLESGKKQSNVKAALLPQTVFRIVKEALNGGIAGSEQQIRYFAFLLAYRCGLRISEILGLLIRDIQIDRIDDTDIVVLVVRPNRHLKQKSINALRKINLHWFLSENELVDFSNFVTYRHQQASGRALLFSLAKQGDQPIERQRITEGVQELMRTVTKNPSFVFHSLRHTFANNMFVALLSLSEIWPTTNEAKKAAKAIKALNEPRQTILYSLAELLGHSSPSVSISSYLHLFDVYLLEQLSHFSFSSKRSVRENEVFRVDIQSLVCSVLNMTDTTLRKRLSRAKQAGVRSQELLMSATLASIENTSFTEFASEDFVELSSSKQPMTWGYNEILSLISLLRRETALDVIKSIFKLSDHQVRAIIEQVLAQFNDKTERGSFKQIRTGKDHLKPVVINDSRLSDKPLYLPAEPSSSEEKRLAHSVFHRLNERDTHAVLELVQKGFKASNKTLKFRRVDDFSRFCTLIKRFNLMADIVSLSVHESKPVQFESWIKAIEQAGVSDVSLFSVVKGAVVRESCLIKVRSQSGQLADGWRYAILLKALASRITSVI